MRSSISFRLLAALTVVATVSAAGQATKPLPLKYVGPATVPAITQGDLMTRLYKYADDSMMGRDVGTIYHLKAAAYIEGELRKMGLQPGGTNGSFYQDFPLWGVLTDPASALTVKGQTLKNGNGFLLVPGSGQLTSAAISVIVVGNMYDTTTTLDTAVVKGKLLLLRPVTPPSTDAATMNLIRSSTSWKNYLRALSLAAGRLQVQDSLPRSLVNNFSVAQTSMVEPKPTGGIMTAVITTATAEAILGAPIASFAKGQVSAPIAIDARVLVKTVSPGRNVIGILPGSDPKLKGQYVAIGAHSDHVGFDSIAPMRGEHDSLDVLFKVSRPAGAEGGRNTPLTPAEWAQVNTDIAALRMIYPMRRDSIFNGADDDGSGSVSVLEIAEAFSKMAIKPKRSLIFVWHAGEEHGMWGSGYFMDNPTIPRDSIVTQLNIDMVGRGAATDVTGQAKGPVNPANGLAGAGPILHGSDNYLQLVGSRRLSTELGDLVEKVNTDNKHGFVFDYNIDADGHQQSIYCRSDHWSYAKWGVPVVFFTTGGHSDYHQFTDEPQYIRYDHMAKVDRLIFDIAAGVANLDHRVVVDKPKGDPKAVCKQ